MKIHAVEIRHVRQIKELALDLSAPLTVIGGPNGVGKTTVQQAILAAMFLSEKKVRDSLISRFDPDSPPTVVLGLSRGDSTASIVFTRYLADDKGEWSEGANVIKKKGQALKEVQKVFPISADAAALLLWGRQEDMTAVIDRFPSDGHSLLTSAAVRGSGPDPKEIIHTLAKQIDDARKGERGGQVVGALTQAKNGVDALTRELTAARTAEAELKTRREQWEQAKSQREQTKTRFTEAETEVGRLARLADLLEAGLQDAATLTSLEETQAEWAGLEEEIAGERKDITALESELEQLRSQYRVARDQELAAQIEKARKKVKLIEELENACAELEAELKSRKRPEPADVKKYHELRAQINEAEHKMEASGVRYELGAASGSRTLRLAEDDAAAREIVLKAGDNLTGIVGRLSIEVDGLRITAGGKEDISRHKRVTNANTAEIQVFFDRFGVENEAVFLNRANEKQELTAKLKEKSNARKLQLGASSLESVRDELKLLERGRDEVRLTLSDREAYAGKPLPAAADLNAWCRQREGEVIKAKENLASRGDKRPTEANKTLHAANLETVRRKARASAAAFKDTDILHREPSHDLQKSLKTALDKKRGEQSGLSASLLDLTGKVAELEGQLKQTCPHRPVELIEGELRETEAFHQRELVLQKARRLLIERIEQKMAELTAHVPVELGKRITEHLAELTGGAFSDVKLHPELALAHVGENGLHAGPWHPTQLSHGERHLAALAIKIAVARALAETTGPVFIMLDDSLVTFDPQRRAATEKWFLDLVADEKLQVVLFTCHTDWAAEWKRRCPELMNYVELAKQAHYYRDPPAVVANRELLRM